MTWEHAPLVPWLLLWLMLLLLLSGEVGLTKILLLL
jgi:hypothetical protein